jgi:transcriptional regulator with XRE-family HTH domain
MGEARKYKTDMRSLRTRLGFTLQEVADLVGIAKQTLSDWERGQIDLKLRIDQTKKLLEVYNISFLELAEAWESTERRPSRKEVIESAKLKEAIQTH